MKIKAQVKQWTSRTNSANLYLDTNGNCVQFSSTIGLVQEDVVGNGNMFVVAEGMGGLSNDRLASELAIRILYKLFTYDLYPWSEQELRNFMIQTHKKIREQIAKEKFPLMGCSGLVVWIKQDQLIWCSIGRGSLGFFRNNKYIRLNSCHSFAEFAKRDGENPPERGERLAQAWFYGSKLRDQAANIRIDPGMDTGSLWIQPNDTFVLSSSGLVDKLSQQEIEGSFQQPDILAYYDQFAEKLTKDTITITLQIHE